MVTGLQEFQIAESYKANVLISDIVKALVRLLGQIDVVKSSHGCHR